MTRKFNLSSVVREILSDQPLINGAEMFKEINYLHATKKVTRSACNGAYYAQRKKFHTKTSQRTTGFNQKSLNVETLKSAATLIESVGKKNAVDAVTLLAKLMK